MKRVNNYKKNIVQFCKYANDTFFYTRLISHLMILVMLLKKYLDTIFFETC